VSEDARTPVERLIEESFEDPEFGPHIERTSLQRRRSVEGYLNAGGPPRWMERLGQIDRGIARETRRLQEAHRALAARCRDDADRLAREWRSAAERWDFGELNELIEQHNEWFPIERRLPIDLRTRDYVLVHGRSYRRPLLDAGWVLERFPPVP
jgi:hypothetical protein